jgi:NitT/TauT family transport system substrate-binding protein
MMRGGNWGRRLLTVLACVALVVAGCGDNMAAPTGQTVTPVRVALVPGGSTLPAHVAMTKGMCERNGLRIELTEGTDLPVFMAALAKDQYDIVMSVPTLALIGAEKHLDLQIVAGLQRQSRERPNAVWITKDPSIETLAQLKGKTIAVPSLTGIIADALVYLLKRNGVQRSDVKLVQTPFPTMGDQLHAGNVDAAVATIPFYTAIAARGFRVHDDVIVEAVQDASGGTVDTAITSVWSASRTFAREHPEMIAAWRKSLTEATDFLDANESEARGLMGSWLKIPEKVIEGAPLPDWTVEITPQALTPYVTISKAVGSIRTDPDVNSLVWQGP